MTEYTRVSIEDAVAVIHAAKVADNDHYCGYKDPRNGCDVWYADVETLGYLADAGITLQVAKDHS